jgi:hypothetical protein
MFGSRLRIRIFQTIGVFGFLGAEVVSLMSEYPPNAGLKAQPFLLFQVFAERNVCTVRLLPLLAVR